MYHFVIHNPRQAPLIEIEIFVLSAGMISVIRAKDE
jgi:hypothetical protein